MSDMTKLKDLIYEEECRVEDEMFTKDGATKLWYEGYLHGLSFVKKLAEVYIKYE